MANDTGLGGTTSDYIVRDGRKSDWPLFKNAFAQVYSGRRSRYGYGVPPAIVVTKLQYLLDSDNWKLIVVCPRIDTDFIIGCLLYQLNKPPHKSNPAVGWLTIRPHYQRKGFGRAMLAHVGIVPGPVECAFLLPDVRERLEKYGYILHFRPYLPEVALIETLAKESQ